MLYPEAKSIVESEMMGRWPDYDGWQNPAIIGAWSRLFAKYEQQLVLESIDALWAESKGKAPNQGRFTEITGSKGHGGKKTPVGYTDTFVVCVEHKNSWSIGTKEQITYSSASIVPDADTISRQAQKVSTQRALCYGGAWQVIRGERRDILDGTGQPHPQWYIEDAGEMITVGSYCHRLKLAANKTIEPMATRPERMTEKEILDDCPF
jgi:hypothetical protein